MSSAPRGDRFAVLATVGTRGDVEPCIALGERLQAAGVDVALAAPVEFARLVNSHGMRFSPIDIEIADSVIEWNRRDGPNRQHSQGPSRSWWKDWLADNASTLVDAAEQALAEADVVVCGGFMTYPTIAIASMLGKPAVKLNLQPFFPSRELPPWALTTRDLGPFNKAAWDLVLRASAHVASGVTQEIERRHGRQGIRLDSGLRSRFRDAHTLTLNAWSPVLLGQPEDYPESAVQVGFVCSSPSQELSAGVDDFIRAGTPPVFAGLGSMAHVDPLWFAEAAISASRRNGRRLILARGRPDLSSCDIPAAGDDVLLIDSEPYDRLFSRCSAVIHHAGAGTTHTAAAAGVAQVPVPVMLDQPLWARSVRSLGVASEPLGINRLTAQRLTEALGNALQSPMRDRAMSVAQRLRLEPNPASVAAGLVMRQIVTI